MARRDQPTYTVTPEWRERVRAELARRGRGSAAALARHAKCATSTLVTLLDHGKTSHLVPAINEALGWPPPGVPLSSPDAPELAYLYDRLDDDGRAALIAMAKALARLPKRR